MTAANESQSAGQPQLINHQPTCSLFPSLLLSPLLYFQEGGAYTIFVLFHFVALYFVEVSVEHKAWPWPHVGVQHSRVMINNLFIEYFPDWQVLAPLGLTTKHSGHTKHTSCWCTLYWSTKVFFFMSITSLSWRPHWQRALWPDSRTGGFGRNWLPWANLSLTVSN